MTYIPAPPVIKKAKIGWLGQTKLTIPDAGLDIVPGVGMVARTDLTNGRLLLDGATSGPAESVCHFQPGALAAGTIGTYANDRASGLCFITLAETNLKTAPTGADGVNNLTLQVAGSVAGSLTVPLLGARNVNSFNNAAKVIYEESNPASGNTVSGTNYVRGMQVRFKPSAQTTVSGLSFEIAAWGPGGGVDPGAVTFELMDDSFNVLASAVAAYPYTTAADGFVTVQFPYTVTLNTNTYYRVGYRSAAAQGVDNRGSLRGYWSNNPGPVGMAVLDPSPSWMGTLGAGPTTTWAQAYASSTFLDPSTDAVTIGGQYPLFRLIGGNGGTTLTGNIVLSILTNGTGGTTPGQDMNVRLQLAAVL